MDLKIIWKETHCLRFVIVISTRCSMNQRGLVITYPQFWGRIFVFVTEKYLLGIRTHLDQLFSQILWPISNLRHDAHERFEIAHLLCTCIFLRWSNSRYYAVPKKPTEKICEDNQLLVSFDPFQKYLLRRLQYYMT